MIKKYLGVLAVVVALCGIMTVSASATEGNYLYNGVELPALPEIDMEEYPYITIVPFPYGGNSYGLYYGKVVNVEYSSNYGDCPVMSQCYMVFTNANNDAWYIDEDYSGFSAGGVMFTSGVVWSNVDYVKSDGTIIFPASEAPIPVGGDIGTEDPPETGSGFDTLEGLTVFFSSSALDYEKGSVWWRIEGLNPDLTYTVQVKLYGSDNSTDIVHQNEYSVSSTDVFSDMIFYEGLAAETTYRANLTIWQNYEHTKTAETSFTTDALPSSGGTTTPDDTENPEQDETEKDSLEEWDKVTEVPDSVKDKTEQGDKIKEDMDALEKPDPEEIVPDIDVDITPVKGLLEKIFSYQLIIEMMMIVTSMAFAGIALYGKRK